MPKPRSRAEAVLWELCVTYGYCIGPEKTAAIAADPPDDPDAFLDAVLRAEGYDHPEVSVDKRDRDELLAVIRDWLFDDGQGRGTKSGLPRI